MQYKPQNTDGGTWGVFKTLPVCVHSVLRFLQLAEEWYFCWRFTHFSQLARRRPVSFTLGNLGHELHLRLEILALLALKESTFAILASSVSVNKRNNKITVVSSNVRVED